MIFIFAQGSMSIPLASLNKLLSFLTLICYCKLPMPILNLNNVLRILLSVIPVLIPTQPLSCFQHPSRWIHHTWVKLSIIWVIIYELAASYNNHSSTRLWSVLYRRNKIIRHHWSLILYNDGVLLKELGCYWNRQSNLHFNIYDVKKSEFMKALILRKKYSVAYISYDHRHFKFTFFPFSQLSSYLYATKSLRLPFTLSSILLFSASFDLTQLHKNRIGIEKLHVLA